MQSLFRHFFHPCEAPAVTTQNSPFENGVKTNGGINQMLQLGVQPPAAPDVISTVGPPAMEAQGQAAKKHFSTVEHTYCRQWVAVFAPYIVRCFTRRHPSS